MRWVGKSKTLLADDYVVEGRWIERINRVVAEGLLKAKAKVK